MLILYGDVAAARMHGEEVLAGVDEERFGRAFGLASTSGSYRHTPRW